MGRWPSEQLQVERLSKPLGLGVLSCDGIPSANYGSELILHELLPFFGLAAFSLLQPMTGVILLGVALVVLSYREVVTVYTHAGGSHVVARENFGFDALAAHRTRLTIWQLGRGTTAWQATQAMDVPVQFGSSG